MRARAERPLLAGLGIWGLAAACAIVGQRQVEARLPLDARPWFVVAAVLGLVGMWLLDRVPGVDWPPPAEGPADAWQRSRLGLILVTAGGVTSLAAAALVGQRTADLAATGLWAGGLVALVVGATRLSQPAASGRLAAWSSVELLGLLGILVVAALLRLVDLADVPPNLHGDELSIGLEARRILAGELPPVFATGWYDVPSLSFAIHAATMALFANTLVGLRLASAIEGLATIALLFALGRRLWGTRPALLAAALLAISAWHIHFSRTGFHYMQAPLATLLVLYFLVRATQQRRAVDWALCGLAVGLCVEVYYAARLAPVIAAAYLLYRGVRERGFIRRQAPGLLLLAFAALAFVAPLGEVFAQSPTTFGSRTGGVLIFTPENLQHELQGNQVSTLDDVLRLQAAHTLEAFTIRGETSVQYGHPTPLLDPVTGVLFALSVLAILARVRSARAFLVSSWFWLTLLVGSVLTVDALFSPRVLSGLPALLLGPALLLDRAWRAIAVLGGRRAEWLTAIPIGALLGLSLVANTVDYFTAQVVTRQPAGHPTLLARYAAPIADRYRLYTIGREDWSLTNEVGRFVLPGADIVPNPREPLALPLTTYPAERGAAFFVQANQPDSTARLIMLQSLYPRAQVEEVTDAQGALAFTAVLVDNADLRAANPNAAGT